ncbi:hypothetical protein SK128_014794, partial [Halocaridina rubra]
MERFRVDVIDKLQKIFCIGIIESSSFQCIGLEINSESEGITVSQYQYASMLSPMNIARQRASSKSSELSDKEKKEYRALI